MGKDFAEKMQRLDEAEQLLASCCVRGVVTKYETQMEINRLMLNEARRQLQDNGAGE